MQGKKIALAVVLVLVAIGAVVFTVMRLKAADRAEAPKEFLEHPYELVDRQTFEVMTLPAGEWQKLGHDEWGHFKNPKSGEFTMVAVMHCPNCGAKVPCAEHVSVPGKTPPPAAPRVCPKCGKPF